MNYQKLSLFPEAKWLDLLLMIVVTIIGAKAFSEKSINLSKGILKLRQNEEDKKNISFLLLKEFYPKTVRNSKQLEQANFRSFEIDVNMVLKLNKAWKDQKDYLASMTSKFRTKAKSVFKKSSSLEVREMNEEEIQKESKVIEELYLAVLNRASFSFGALDHSAFANFKKALGSNFVFKGYYLDNKLIGFSSAFVCAKLVDASYVGINYDYNTEHCLYQKMLYDLVDLSIEKGVDELRLGRTAEEIKSGLGAKPVHMKLYMRHRNTVSNHLLKPLIESISPSEFEVRQPFKVNGELA